MDYKYFPDPNLRPILLDYKIILDTKRSENLKLTKATLEEKIKEIK